MISNISNNLNYFVADRQTRLILNWRLMFQHHHRTNQLAMLFILTHTRTHSHIRAYIIPSLICLDIFVLIFQFILAEFSIYSRHYIFQFIFSNIFFQYYLFSSNSQFILANSNLYFIFSHHAPISLFKGTDGRPTYS